MFKEIIACTDIDLSFNEIVTIDKHSFRGLTNLHQLILNDNKIKSIQSDFFKDLIKCYKIYLNNNRITKLHNLTFRGLENLHLLHLKNNLIVCIDEEIWTQINNLKNLHLEFNIICNANFQYLRKLQVPFLFKSKLSSLHRDMFKDLLWLSDLSLHNNNIVNITPSAFANLKSFGFKSQQNNHHK